MQVSLFICSRDLVHSGWECESASSLNTMCWLFSHTPAVTRGRIAACSTGEFGTSYMSAGEKNLHFKFEVHQTHNQICKKWVKLMSEWTSCSVENWLWIDFVSMRMEPGRASRRWTCQTGVAGTLLNHPVQTCINLAWYLYPRACNSIHNYCLNSLYLMCYCFRLRQWNMPYKKHPLLLMVSLISRPHPLSGFGIMLL